MAQISKKTRVEIPDREWLELEISYDEKTQTINDLQYKVFGCHDLREALEKLKKDIVQKKLNEFKWSGDQHWDLLIAEGILKLQDRYDLPYKEDELCHCRKIRTTQIEEAIIYGAHTPEKVRRWTTASSGCGTCRPDVEKMIEYKLKWK